MMESRHQTHTTLVRVNMTLSEMHKNKSLFRLLCALFQHEQSISSFSFFVIGVINSNILKGGYFFQPSNFKRRKFLWLTGVFHQCSKYWKIHWDFQLVEAIVISAIALPFVQKKPPCLNFFRVHTSGLIRRYFQLIKLITSKNDDDKIMATLSN